MLLFNVRTCFNCINHVNRKFRVILPCFIGHSRNVTTTNTQSNQYAHDEIERVRNIGIMAHIDAGKTTTTERMLYFSGLTRHLGDVDDGDTIMDYMEQERDRGITITAAAITFFWNKHKINLIDTPGHVDFTLEVERSLRVLDGAVTILDASAGVEAQTLTVWRQANRYNIPRIIYLNKMDKNGADLEDCVNSVIEKLNVLPLVTQVPIGSGKDFKGLIDLVTLRKHVWQDVDETCGKNYTIAEINQSTEPLLYEQANAFRTKLIEQLADLDEKIANHILSDTRYNDIPMIDLMNALRTATLNQSGVPVLCGSSFKNKGVQPLMNSIVNLFPNPSERTYPFVQYYKDSLCALAFKTVHDKQRGALTFIRIYSGDLNSGSYIYNVNRDSTEKSGKLLQISADEHKEIQSATVGNIVGVTGLKQTVTGDTLVSSLKTAKTAQKLYSKQQQLDDDTSVPVLAGLDVPDPVFMCSIEPPSLSAAKTLDHALQCLTKEDPSLRVTVNEDTGQTIIAGMGELHLEVIKDRILKEYGVRVYMGPLYIAYREAVTSQVEETYSLDRTVGKTRHRATICISITPSEDDTTVSVVPHENSVLDPKKLRRDVLEAIRSGVKSALSRGPVLGFPVVNVKVELHDFTKTFSTSLPMVSACAALCAKQVLQSCNSVLLQPMMTLQIDTDEHYLNTVLGDLSKRHSNIINIESHPPNARTIHANTPLSEMVGYSTALRTLTSGTATFTMQVSHYQEMEEYEQNLAVEKSRGGAGFF